MPMHLRVRMQGSCSADGITSDHIALEVHALSFSTHAQCLDRVAIQNNGLKSSSLR